MEGIEKALPQIKAAHTSIMLLKQLELKEISLEEYLLKCAYWGMKTLDDIYFKSLPSKPLKVLSFEQLSYSKRQKLTDDFFMDNPGILKYYEERERIILENSTSLLNIKTYKKHIPESDIKSHEKLDKKIMDFKIKMRGYEN